MARHIRTPENGERIRVADGLCDGDCAVQRSGWNPGE